MGGELAHARVVVRLSLTPRFSGVGTSAVRSNRFNGFSFVLSYDSRMNALHVSAILALMQLFVFSSRAAPAYPLKKSANNHYLVDQNNQPFLIVGDSPQALTVNLTEAEAASSFE